MKQALRPPRPLLSRSFIARLVFGFALLLTAQAGLAQQEPPEAALSEKCRSEKVENAIIQISLEMRFLEGQLRAWKERLGQQQEDLNAARKEGRSYEWIRPINDQIQRTSGRIREDTIKIDRDRSNLKKLEALPPCAKPKAATDLPPCGDVSAEIKRLTEEVTKLSREETSLNATLVKHTGEYNAAVRDYGNTDPRAQSASSVVKTDQQRLAETREKIESDKKRIAALYGVPPCPEEPKTAAPPTPPGPPPGANPPCRTKDDDSEYARLEAELERLGQAHDNLIKAATNAAGKAALSENNRQIEEVIKKKDAIRAREPCPPQPAAGQVPPTAKPGKVDFGVSPFASRILDIHNAERAAVGAQPLRWNPQLEASATAYAQQLARTQEFVHAPRAGRGIERENLLSAPIGWSPDQMIGEWTREKILFHPGVFPNVCSTGGDCSGVWHYTQMIWPTTTDIGCGMAPGGGFNWVVCRYSPGGNKDGKPVGQSVRGAPERGR